MVMLMSNMITMIMTNDGASDDTNDDDEIASKINNIIKYCMLNLRNGNLLVVFSYCVSQICQPRSNKYTQLFTEFFVGRLVY